jgi:hypothetical protein
MLVCARLVHVHHAAAHVRFLAGCRQRLLAVVAQHRCVALQSGVLWRERQSAHPHLEATAVHDVEAVSLVPLLDDPVAGGHVHLSHDADHGTALLGRQVLKKEVTLDGVGDDERIGRLLVHDERRHVLL